MKVICNRGIFWYFGAAGVSYTKMMA